MQKANTIQKIFTHSRSDSSFPPSFSSSTLRSPSLPVTAVSLREEGGADYSAGIIIKIQKRDSIPEGGLAVKNLKNLKKNLILVLIERFSVVLRHANRYNRKYNKYKIRCKGE